MSQIAAEQAVARQDGPEQNRHFVILGYDRRIYFMFNYRTGQVVAYSRSDLTDNGLLELAPLNWWEDNFPAKNGIDRRAAVNFIFRSAEKRGLYDSSNLRGRGAWLDRRRVVFHAGDKLIVDGVETPLSAIESRYVYMADIPLGKVGIAASDQEGQSLLRVLNMARWVCKDSAMFLAGWIFLAPVCGALNWRPHIWITGGSGSGKSTLVERLIRRLVGDLGLFVDGGGSTEAGVRQSLNADARPVIVDEGEADDETARARINDLLRLPRSSSSADLSSTVKGSVSGHAISYHMRSMFCFASINLALSKSADLGRFSVLHLRPKSAHDLDAAAIDEVRRSLKAIEQDPELAGRLLGRALQMMPIIFYSIRVFTQAVAENRQDFRAGDQHGTLLAGAWCLQHQRSPTREEANHYVAEIDWEAAVSGRVEALPDERRCLEELLDAKIVHKGDPVSVRTLAEVAGVNRAEGLDMDTGVALRLLRDLGMTISRSGGTKYLAIKYSSSGVSNLLAKTRFAVDWAGHLARLSGCRGLPATSFGSRGHKERALGIPMSLFLIDEANAAEGRAF